MDPDVRNPASSPAEAADLVAFLAGELPEDEARSLAAIVARNPTARREFEALRGTWDLLDLLPRPKASDDFGTRTFSALRWVEVVEGDLPKRAGNRPFVIASCATAALVMAALGFAATGRLLPDRTRRLAGQLSLAEHLDEYRDVGSIEFLQGLDKSPEFDEAE